MSQVVALHWNGETLHFAVLQQGRAEAFGSVPMEPNAAPTTLGQRLADALAPHVSGRAKAVVALNRKTLDWQHLSLPPCPADELPDVVRLQADQATDSSDEDIGFDYLSLTGDEQTPYQVLTVSVKPSELERIQQVCRAANLTAERIVPLAIGWPALTKQVDQSGESGTQVFVAPFADEATLWATHEGRVVLFRQFQLASLDDPTTLTASIASELRRTMLALSQQNNTTQPVLSIVGSSIGGNQTAELGELASALDQLLQPKVRPLNVASQVAGMAPSNSNGSALPLAGLGIDESLGNKPLIDLLHPHRRPKPQLNVRTYALAATAAALLLGVIGWSGYANLQNPLDQAEKDLAELTQLEESLDEFGEYEKSAAAIRDWNVETPNLLLHLRQLSKVVRPQSLSEREFDADKDVVLEKFNLEKRELTIDALARNDQAVQPLELRLREADYGPHRGKSSPSKNVPEYPWQFKSTIEITNASDQVIKTANQSATETANAAPTQEPQS